MTLSTAHRMQMPSRKHGASLVVTLLVITILTVIVIAFLQSMQVERATAGSYTAIYRASLAADAAYADIRETLLTNTKSDDFTVLESQATLANSSFPVTFLGSPGSDTLSWIPLFSGGATSTDSPVSSMPSGTNTFINQVQNETRLQAINQFPLPDHINDGNPVNLGWVYMEDDDGEETSRYAFWVEDLGGYLDADLSGDTPFIRNQGSAAAELGIFTLFRPNETTNSEPLDGPDVKLINERTVTRPDDTKLSIMLTTATLNQIEPEVFEPYFAAGLQHFPELAVVPRGFGYANAQQPKKNLNTLVAQGGDEAVQEIASWIDINLPNFDSRKGGFPASQSYLKTLAANMIDYADTDNHPTVGPDYRGVDSYPFLTQIFVQIWWVNGPGENPWYSADGTWRTRLSVSYHIQIWNPSNQPVDSGTLTLALDPVPGNPGEQSAFFYDGSEVMPFYPFPEDPTFSTTFTAANQLLPNEFRAITYPIVEYEMDTGINSAFPAPLTGHTNTRGPRIGTSGYGSNENRSEHGYRILWNGRLVDQPGGVVHSRTALFQQNAGTIPRHPSTSGNGPTWRGTQPGLRHGFQDNIFSTGQSLPLLGDPRGTFYISEYLAAHVYAQGASWWGRHYVSDASTSGIQDWFISEARHSTWPDGAHNSDLAFPIASVPPPNSSGAEATRNKNSTAPDDIPVEDRPPISPSKAPARISNVGFYASLTELGNIHDPIQWRPQWSAGNETIETVEEKWLNLGANLSNPETMVADANYVVPSTLRIGRGEYAPLDQPGTRASQLLDLFTLTPEISVAGRININTASRNVLRTLGAGIQITSDPNIVLESGTPAPLTGPFENEQADILADAIIANRPFMSTAQLSNLRIDDEEGNPQHFLGNPRTWPQNAPTRWIDIAAEEYFRKMFDLTSVRSRNFRIFVIGQALSTDGRVAATSREEIQIAIRPVRDSDGNITEQEILLVNHKKMQ